jgi:cysteine desulfuration protein SufE
MSNSIEDIAKELEEEFAILEDWTDKYEYLIELGKSLPPIAEQYKTEDYIIKGCQSRVWLKSELENDKIQFTADSDAIITRGIVALLITAFTNHTPEEIVNAKTDFIDRIGLKEHLSPTRSNGLVSMIKQMKMDALAFNTRNKN